MQAHIENLVKLQAVDLERARLTTALRDLPVEIAKAETALTKAQRQSADASAALEREETLRTKLEKEVAAHRQKAARLRAQLDTVTTPAQASAIEHETQFADSEADRLETEAFSSLERTETQEAALAAARTAVEETSVTLDKTRAWAAQRKTECENQQTSLAADRETLRQAIGPEWLVRYDRMAATRGTGLARAESQRCSGCRMGVRPQIWNQLREGELLTCDSCGRLLYWDPAIVPATEEPQSAGSAQKSRAAKPRAGE